MLLEPEQEQLLMELVEAERKVPREQRHHFMIARTVGPPGVTLIHQGWGAGRRVFEGDIDTLASLGLLAKASLGSHSDGFYVTPAGFNHYAQLRRAQGQPTERVEAATRTYLDSTSFRQRYPAAYQKWTQAEEQLWGSDSATAFTTIGHLCREAMQEFADALVLRFKPASVDPDKAKTVSRIRSVLGSYGQSSTRVRAFFDAMLVYWGTVNDLVQRQEHGALREGEPLTWLDARRVAFQTAIVMFEIDSSLMGGSRG